MKLEDVAMKMAMTGGLAGFAGLTGLAAGGFTAKEPAAAISLPSVASSSPHHHGGPSHINLSFRSHDDLTLCEGRVCDRHGVAYSSCAQHAHSVRSAWAARRGSESMLSPLHSRIAFSHFSRTSSCNGASCAVSCGAPCGASCGGVSRCCLNQAAACSAAASRAGFAGSCLAQSPAGYAVSCQPQVIKRRRSLLSLATSASTSPVLDKQHHHHYQQQHPQQQQHPYEHQVLAAQHGLITLDDHGKPRSATGGVIGGAVNQPSDTSDVPLQQAGSFSTRRRTGCLRRKAIWRSTNTSPVTSVTTQSPTGSDDIPNIGGIMGVGASAARLGAMPSTRSAPNLHALNQRQTLRVSSSQPDSIHPDTVLQYDLAASSTLPAQQSLLLQQLQQMEQVESTPTEYQRKDSAFLPGAVGAAGAAGAAAAAAIGPAAAVSALTQQLPASASSHQRTQHRPLFDSLWMDDSDAFTALNTAQPFTPVNAASLKRPRQHLLSSLEPLSALPAIPAASAIIADVEASALSSAGKRSWRRATRAEKGTWQEKEKGKEKAKEKTASSGAAPVRIVKDGLAELEAFMEASMGRMPQSPAGQAGQEGLKPLDVVVMGLQVGGALGTKDGGSVGGEWGQEKAWGGEQEGGGSMEPPVQGDVAGETATGGDCMASGVDGAAAAALDLDLRL
ncbi:hypothetical protein CLOM_g2133 [Closterium sp. NIES-68]|nr:hypothetical protein CLOM_g2133 [Closterium sp. NIES-68]GJP70818.1 hypothetical protein CLOP_g1714 [Closterium sp. NIES-67]